MTKGALPTWLAPVQVSVIPVSNEYHLEYSKMVVDKLKKAGIRVNLNDKDEKLGYRMREAQTKKIPYTLVLGDKEREANTVNYRVFGSQEQTSIDLDEFVSMIKKVIDDKELLNK